MRQAEDLTVRIDALSYGRAAVARTDGKVVFVEGAAPGDLARVRVRRDHDAYIEAELTEVLDPGACRVSAPCPIVDQCGGCCWQHVSYDEQLRWKRAAVIDALQRIGGIDAAPVRAVVPSPRALGYRNRLRLRFENGRLGFYQARTHSLVPIADCLIAEEPVRQALPAVERFVATLDTRVTRVEIASRGVLPGVVLAINSKGRLRRADSHRVEDFLRRRDHGVSGVAMWGRGWQRRWGDVRRREAVEEDLRIETQAASFGQVNSDANRLLVASVVQAAAPQAGDRVLDLYAGAGNFSLPLARRCRRVDAVEADARSAETGRECAAHHGIRNVEFHAEAVERFLARSCERSPDLVIVNPPRDGLTATTKAIARLGAPRLVYVSCNPATLARDMRELVAAGYELQSVTPVDLFPHTFHVESVCHARLT
jgi:23S rRNA (uracil1939-C5)-methyltransferase